MKTEILFELNEYTTSRGNVHHFKNYLFDPIKIKLYKRNNEGDLYPLKKNNGYFYVTNTDGKHCCLSWMKLTHIYLNSIPKEINSNGKTYFLNRNQAIIHS